MFSRIGAAAALFGALLLAGTSFAGTKEEPVVKGRAGITAATKYIPNGFSFVKNPVYQFGLDLDRRHFGITLFGNYNTDNERRVFDEKDYIARFSYPFGDFTTTASYGFYQFNAPDAPKRSQDITLGIKYNGPVSFFVSAAHDFDKIGGNYGKAGISKSVPVWKVNVGVEGVIWFNDHYFHDEGGVSSSKITGSVSADIGSNTNVTAFVSHVHGLRDGFEDHFFGGVEVSVDFVPSQTD
jgi:hypothetical protein